MDHLGQSGNFAWRAVAAGRAVFPSGYLMAGVSPAAVLDHRGDDDGNRGPVSAGSRFAEGTADSGAVDGAPVARDSRSPGAGFLSADDAPHLLGGLGNVTADLCQESCGNLNPENTCMASP